MGPDDWSPEAVTDGEEENRPMREVKRIDSSSPWTMEGGVQEEGEIEVGSRFSLPFPVSKAAARWGGRCVGAGVAELSSGFALQWRVHWRAGITRGQARPNVYKSGGPSGMAR